MKNLFVRVLCFSIFFNSFVAILSKTVYAVEDYNQQTIEQNKDKDDKWKTYLDEVDKKKAGIFTAVLIGVGTGAFLIFRHVRKISKVIASDKGVPEFEEEEQEISDGVIQ